MTAPTLDRPTRREATGAEVAELLAGVRGAARSAAVAIEDFHAFVSSAHPSEYDGELTVTLCDEPGARSVHVPVEVAVNSGVAFLDERLGRGEWLQRIDVTTLNVRAQSDCVLAQVTGKTYVDALDVLGVPFDGSTARTKWTDARGFSRDLTGDGWADERYARLTTAWVTKVEQLRAEVSA